MKNVYKIKDDVVYMDVMCRGKKLIAKFSEQDLPTVSSITGTWYADVDKSGKRYIKGRNNGKVVILHRFIMSPPEGMVVDHENGDTLNNTRDNLKVCTNKDNTWTRTPVRGSYTKFRGIAPYRDRWIAQVIRNGKPVLKAYYYDIIEAAMDVTTCRNRIDAEEGRESIRIPIMLGGA